MRSDVILFLAANPIGTSRLCLAEECAAIERELRAAATHHLAFHSKWAVTVDEMMRQLNALQPTVIHFSGHGSGGDVVAGPTARPRDACAAAERTASPGIYLQDDSGSPQAVTADALSAMVESAAASARIVVLNACYTDAQAEALCRVVDCVIGMNGPIGDDAAREFATSFYRALAHQRSVANAVAQVAATLGAKGLAAHHLPRYRTRRGVDGNAVVLSTSVTRDESWGRRFEAILRLSQAACDKLASDPLSAAMRARQAIGHIVDYLYERELAAAEDDRPIGARFERINAKLAICPLVASHFRSVLVHTGLAIKLAGVESDPAPALLTPCLGSLAIAVEWFFHGYLKRPEVNIGCGMAERAVAERPAVPDAVPLNSTMTTIANTATLATDHGEFVPIWRSVPGPSLLRIVPEDGDALEQRTFRIEVPGRRYLIGRGDQRSDGTPNDFEIPGSWTSVSRNQGTLTTGDRGVLLVNTSGKHIVFVRGESLPPDAAYLLRHGDVVQFGQCIGTFQDGRYYVGSPPAAFDPRTSLLSRRGLIAEITGSLATGDERVLYVLRCPEHAVAGAPGRAADPEQLAASVALAIHRQAPATPVARLGMHVAALLNSAGDVDALAAVAQAEAGAHCVSGFATMTGPPEQATRQLEACLGALNRIAIAGEPAAAPEDLARHSLAPIAPLGFASRARQLLDIGGGAVSFALGDRARLNSVAPQLVSVLEREFLEVLGARMGPGDIVSVVAPGVVLFATPGDVERCAHEISVVWHARGPATADQIEIDRWVSVRLLAAGALEGAAQPAIDLVERQRFAAVASGLPSPLALAAQAIDRALDVVDRVHALVRLADVGWKLLAFVLLAAARRGGDTAPPVAELAAPAAWQELALAAARRLEGQPRRVIELASVAMAPDRDAVLGSAMHVIAEHTRLVAATPDPHLLAQSLPQLEAAVRALLAALAPLRGWTLVGVMDAQVVDLEGATQRIEYIDHTGPAIRGSQQRITVARVRPIGRFVHLVRWHEALTIALEPFVRCTRNPTTGGGELFLATAPIEEPGRHRYRSAHDTREIEQVVTGKQLGRSGEEVVDDAATG